MTIESRNLRRAWLLALAVALGAALAAALGAGLAVAPGVARAAAPVRSAPVRSAAVRPAPVRSAAVRSAAVRPAPGRAAIPLALPLRADVTGLERFARAVSTPGSPRYGQYEPVSTLARRFGASSSDRARAVRFLRGAGARDVKVDATGLFVDATLRVADAQRLFGTGLGEYRSARAGRFMAPRAPVRIPAGLSGAATGVVGLDTRPVFGSAAAHAGARVMGAGLAGASEWSHVAAADQTSGYPNRTGTATGCGAATGQSGFTPNQYLTAYGYAPLQAAGLEGQGERVALIEIDGFKYSDLRRFSKCFGLATPAINGFGVGLKRPLPPGGETTLDLEVLDAAAPRLKAVDVYESRPNATDVLRSLTAPLTNRGSKPNVISASLGSCEAATAQALGAAGLRTVEGSLALAAASGISVLASSGDDGSSACLSSNGRPLPGLAVSYPASSPWVTGVGGTNISLDAGNDITGQIVWNDSPVVVAAGGGGSSRIFNRPAYQNGFAPGAARSVPDVSMLADVAPGYEIYCTAKSDCVSRRHPSPWSQVGGTSAAAPLVAGGLALIDQDLREHGHQDVGLANPLLYAIAASPQSSSVLSDVAQGENDLGMSIDGEPTGCCTAAAGYDEASGLGSVNLAGLASVAGTLVPPIVNVGLSVPRQRHPVAARHLLARVICSGRCLAGAFVRIRVGRSRRLITQKSSVYLLRRAGRRTVRINFKGSVERRLRAALASRTRITGTVYGAILDPSGNVESRTRGVKVRISG